MKIQLILLISIFMLGCGSPPDTDDYTKHVNQLNIKSKSVAKFKFDFSDNSYVDLRGHYNRDNSANATHILYAGDAGLVGLIAQIGAHSAMVSSERNSKLAKLQLSANQEVKPLIDLASKLSIESLLSKDSIDLLASAENNGEEIVVKVKPIFYSTSDMSQIFVKSIAWIPHETKKNRFQYKNLIQVYSSKFDIALNENLDDLPSVLSGLLAKSLQILERDIQGKYEKLTMPQKTFFVKENENKKVVRGRLVDSDCQFDVIKNLHSWYIAIPKTPLSDECQA